MKEFFFPSESNCLKGQTVDGKDFVQKPNFFCLFYVFLLVVMVVLQVLALAAHIVPLPLAIAGIVFGVFLTIVMYKHCKVCKGWSGFWKVVVMNWIFSSVVYSGVKKKGDGATPTHAPTHTKSPSKAAKDKKK